VSALSTFIIIEYFAGGKGSPITYVKDELLLWATIMAYPLSLFAYTTILLGAYSRMRARRPKAKYRGVIFFSVFIFFAILCFSSPAQLQGNLFISINTFTASFVGSIMSILTLPLMIVVALRMFMNTRTVDGITFMVVFSALFALERTTVFTVLWPDARNIGTWIDSIPVAGSQTGIILVAGVSAVILNLRAIVQKELGTIEMEAV